MTEPRGERRNFNGDCCPSMVEMKARWADHVVGAEGVNHRTIADMMRTNNEQHAEIIDSIAEFRKEISAKFDSVQKRQWYMSGGLAVVVGALTWLGPSGLKQMFSLWLGPSSLKQIISLVEAIITGGWNG